MANDPILDAVDALTGPFLDSGLAEMEVEVGGITVRLARPRPPRRRRPRPRPPPHSAKPRPAIGSSPPP